MKVQTCNTAAYLSLGIDLEVDSVPLLLCAQNRHPQSFWNQVDAKPILPYFSYLRF